MVILSKSDFKYWTSFVTVIIATLICNNLAGQNGKQIVNFTDKWDTVSVLKNPYKGWYHHILDNQIKAYPIINDSVFEKFPGMDHLYIRLSWGFLEPQEGVYDWHYINDILKKYVPKGYKISF